MWGGGNKLSVARTDFPTALYSPHTREEVLRRTVNAEVNEVRREVTGERGSRGRQVNEIRREVNEVRAGDALNAIRAKALARNASQKSLHSRREPAPASQLAAPTSASHGGGRSGSVVRRATGQQQTTRPQQQTGPQQQSSRQQQSSPRVPDHEVTSNARARAAALPSSNPTISPRAPGALPPRLPGAPVPPFSPILEREPSYPRQEGEGSRPVSRRPLSPARGGPPRGALSPTNNAGAVLSALRKHSRKVLPAPSLSETLRTTVPAFYSSAETGGSTTGRAPHPTTLPSPRSFGTTLRGVPLPRPGTIGVPNKPRSLSPTELRNRQMMQRDRQMQRAVKGVTVSVADLEHLQRKIALVDAAHQNVRARTDAAMAAGGALLPKRHSKIVGVRVGGVPRTASGRSASPKVVVVAKKKAAGVPWNAPEGAKTTASLPPPSSSHLPPTSLPPLLPCMKNPA